jgi:hypothetical protein
MRPPFWRGCRHGCRQHIGLERILCSEINREGFPIRIQNVAEGEGFEPPKACTLVVFKPASFSSPQFANVRPVHKSHTFRPPAFAEVRQSSPRLPSRLASLGGSMSALRLDEGRGSERLDEVPYL